MIPLGFFGPPDIEKLVKERNLSKLHKLLASHKNPRIREQAAAGLGRISDAVSIPFLVSALNDADSSVQKAGVHSLGRIRQSAPVLIYGLSNESTRALCEEALMRMGENAVPFLQDSLISPQVQKEAGRILAAVMGENAVGPLIPAIHDDRSSKIAADLLVKIGSPAVKPLISYFSNSAASIKYRIIGILKGIDHPDIVPFLLSALEDEAWNVRCAAIDALGAKRDPSSVNPLFSLALNDVQSLVQKEAINALAAIKNNESLKMLSRLMKEAADTIRSQATEVLSEINDVANVSNLFEIIRTSEESAFKRKATSTLAKIADELDEETLTELMKIIEDNNTPGDIRLMILEILEKRSVLPREESARFLTFLRAQQWEEIRQFAKTKPDLVAAVLRSFRSGGIQRWIPLGEFVKIIDRTKNERFLEFIKDYGGPAIAGEEFNPLVNILAKIGGDRSVRAIVDLLRSVSKPDLIVFAEALRRAAKPRYVPMICEAMDIIGWRHIDVSGFPQSVEVMLSVLKTNNLPQESIYPLFLLAKSVKHKSLLLRKSPEAQPFDNTIRQILGFIGEYDKKTLSAALPLIKEEFKRIKAEDHDTLCEARQTYDHYMGEICAVEADDFILAQLDRY